MDEPFAFGTSLIHRLDPRVKIACAAVFSVVVATAGRFSMLFAALLFSTSLVIAARLNPSAIGGRLKAVLTFLLLMWLVLPVTYEGEPLFRIGPFSVTHPGMVLAAQVSLKALAILFALIALTTTMTFATTGQALRHLKVPAKIVILLIMTYRYIFVIEQEFQRLFRAAHIRGFKPKTCLHTYRTYAYLFGMLFVRASTRAERVHHAMLCRGFRGRFYSLSEFTIANRDLIFMAVFSAVTAFLLWLQWFKKGVFL